MQVPIERSIKFAVVAVIALAYDQLTETRSILSFNSGGAIAWAWFWWPPFGPHWWLIVPLVYGKGYESERKRRRAHTGGIVSAAGTRILVWILRAKCAFG